MHSAEEMIACYQGTLKQVKLALPVNYTQILRLACQIAEQEYESKDIGQVQNYHVLVLLMAGVIDDLDSALNQLLRAKNIPVSIVIVKVGRQDEQDSKILLDRAAGVLQSCERGFASLIDLEQFKMQDGRLDNRKFSLELVKNLPREIEKFFEMQQLDLDISSAFAESPRQTLVSISDIDSPASGQST